MFQKLRLCLSDPTSLCTGICLMLIQRFDLVLLLILVVVLLLAFFPVISRLVLLTSACQLVHANIKTSVVILM